MRTHVRSRKYGPGPGRQCGRLGLKATIVAALALGCLLLAWAHGPAIVIELRVPAGSYPTIVTDTDNSGLYKFDRVSANAYRLVNADEKIGLVIIRDPNRTTNELGVSYDYDGSNGPDPVPGTVVISWYTGGAAQESRHSLQRGQKLTCSTCDTLQIKIEK